MPSAQRNKVSDPIKPWPADRIERRSVASLIPNARNARMHSEAQVAQIAASIREWGWTTPVLIDTDGTIIAGHGRVLAARMLHIADIPVMIAEGWTDAQKRAYIIADNQLTLNADWDLDLLAVELRGLGEEGFDLDLIGFDPDALANLLADKTEGLTDPDDVPDAPLEPVTKLGDVWLLGKHRIVCGDCTDAGVVAKALNGVTPHLMVTDPPYGVDYDASWRSDPRVAAKIRHPTKGAIGRVENDHRADWREAWALFPGEVAYVWHGGLQSNVVEASLSASGFELRAQIVWAKNTLVIGRGHYHGQHEPCWYAVRSGATGHWQGDRKQTTLWQFASVHRTRGNAEDMRTNHSTQKPVECMKRPIENNSSAGQAVYEPFSGSGTTIIAAEMTGRACHAIELNPAYVDVAVIRWQDFTGQKAILEGSTQTFDELRNAQGTQAHTH